MKASFESIHSTAHSSFVVRRFEARQFDAPYHFHPEYELTLILAGCGKRYVGSHMADYLPGDLVLLGSNTPHCWKTEWTEDFPVSGSIVIQFQPDFLGAGFFDRPEMAAIAQLLSKSGSGIHFTGNINWLKNKMQALLKETKTFLKLLLLLEILHALASHSSAKLLNKQNLFSALPVSEKERMHLVTAYIVENFRDAISLGQAAAVANMTPQAFCRYFKRISRKTFIEAVTDYRMNYAMQELVHTSKPVTEIGFESGFNDISNFYKTFKERLKMSPLHYRNAFVKKL